MPGTGSGRRARPSTLTRDVEGSRRAAYAQLLLVTALFGGTWPAGKVAVDHLPPLTELNRQATTSHRRTDSPPTTPVGHAGHGTVLEPCDGLSRFRRQAGIVAFCKATARSQVASFGQVFAGPCRGDRLRANARKVAFARAANMRLTNERAERS